eukprot:scaffold20944_cov56-Phaeocystis_antarctica.AAC.7
MKDIVLRTTVLPPPKPCTGKREARVRVRVRVRVTVRPNLLRASVVVPQFLPRSTRLLLARGVQPTVVHLDLVVTLE